MNATTIKKNTHLFGALLSFGLVSSASAATIYDNSVNDLVTRFDPGTAQVGDQIILAGTERYLTSFSFEYWGLSATPGVFSSPVTARVQFYDNTGTPFNGYGTPNNRFYDSGWFPVTPTARNTLVFQAGADFPSGGLFIPVDEMTWTVQFSGMGSTDSAGLDIYDPPTVGQYYPDYWEFSGGSWKLMTNGVPVNFAAHMEAVVPEPSTTLLSLTGGVALLLAAGRLRRTA